MAPLLPLVVIDVQPCYQSAFWCTTLMDRLVDEVKRRLKAKVPVYLVHNDSELSGDERHDIEEFWLEHRLSAAALRKCTFIEKQYAELRGWMDHGVEDEDIVETLKVLRARNLWDSRDLSKTDLREVSDAGAELCNPLFRSHYLETSPLVNLPELDICGGARHQCLREVELWLQSHDVTYNRIEHLVY